MNRIGLAATILALMIAALLIFLRDREEAGIDAPSMAPSTGVGGVASPRRSQNDRSIDIGGSESPSTVPSTPAPATPGDLGRLQPLRFRLLDALKNPVVGLAVSIHHGDYSWSGRFFETERSGKDGRIEVPPAVTSTWPASVRAQLTAVPALPLVEPKQIAVEARHFEGEELALEVPGFGALEVILVNRTGEDLPPAVAVELRLEVLLEPRSDAPSPSYWMGPFTAKASNGRTRFPFVPIGRTARLAPSPDASVAGESVDSPPLRFAGEVRTVELVLSRLKRRLSCRLIDAGSSPAAGGSFEVREVGRGGAYAPERLLIADGFGRLSLDLERDGRFEGRRTIRLIEKAEPPRFADVTVSADALPASGDVGDVMLREAPMIAAGHVMNRDGAPIQGARVIAVVRSDETSYALNDHRNVSDTLGRFEIRGIGFEGRVGLTVVPPPGYRFSDAAEAVVGTRDLEILLDRSRTLGGTVNVDADLGAFNGRLFAYPADSAGDVLSDGAMVHGAAASGGAAYRFVDLRGTPVEVKFVLTTETTAVQSLDLSGDPSDGDRVLPPVDLRKRIRRHRLTVTDADGKPLPRAEVLAGSMLEEPRRSPYFGFMGKTSNVGTIELMVSTPAPPVRVSAKGFESRDAVLIGNDSTVVLRPLR